MSKNVDALWEIEEPWLVLGDREFRSRLLVGIEQYDDARLVRRVLEASGADVFITTMDPDNQRSSLLLSDLADELPVSDYQWIGTTSFAKSPESALQTARMLRDLYGINVMKLDVRADGNVPDNQATIKAAETLRAEGMELLPFILPDPVVAKTLEGIGCAALRVMSAPVASGRGIPEPARLREVIDATSLPVIIEGGLGSARHVTFAMELGAAGVLVNTALIKAAEPLMLAAAMKHSVIAGALSYRSKPMDGDPF